jgi:hypothetical protein
MVGIVSFDKFLTVRVLSPLSMTWTLLSDISIFARRTTRAVAEVTLSSEMDFPVFEAIAAVRCAGVILRLAKDLAE